MQSNVLGFANKMCNSLPDLGLMQLLLVVVVLSLVALLSSLSLLSLFSRLVLVFLFESRHDANVDRY